MNLKERLLKIKDNVHTTEIFGEKIHFKLFKATHRSLLRDFKDEEQDAMLFLMCVCDEEGNRIFGDDDLESVLQLPQRLVAHVVHEIVSGNEKKQ